ncbi:Golgi transport complex subunit 4, partial [Linderina macrospora]
MATETEPARQYGGDLDTATLDDLAASIDIAEIEQAYRLLELEEARVDVEISEHIEARHDVETRFASLSLLQDQLETIVDDLVPVQSAIDTTAANAGAISSHVRFLDRELTKYESALRAVEDTERLKHDADDLLAAMQRKDIDVAAALINRYLAVSAKVLENPFVAFASKGEPAPEIIGGARRELVERVTYMFETAAESGNTKEISRCVRLFPLLGEELQGLDMYAGFLCSLVADKARVPGEPKGSVYALRLTRLFEVIAVVVDAHFPVIETHYGPGRMIRVIQRLQIEGAKRAAMILDFFEEERHVKRRLTQIHHADASAARNKSRAQLLSDKERPPRMSEEVVTDDDLKEITSILTELVLIGRQIAVFSRFLESRARPELSVLTDKAGGAVTDKTGLAIRADAVPSVFLKPDDVLKLIPLSMQQSVLGNAKKAIEFDPQTGLVVDTPLTVRLA